MKKFVKRYRFWLILIVLILILIYYSIILYAAIIERDKVNPENTKIVCDAVDIRLDAPAWIREKKDV